MSPWGQQKAHPFISRLIEDLFAEDQDAEEQVQPIGDREFLLWLSSLGTLLILFAYVLRTG